ncbi:thioredoxin-disulfide reductase, partial [Halorubrum distributum]
MSGVAIIGGGPTGLNAAIYTARADKRTLVFDDGGGTTRDVDTMENVYGFPEGVTGPELVDLGREHARKYGAEIVEEEVVRIEPEGERYRVETTVDEYVVDGVVIATGADYERPAIADVEAYEGHGVSYCVECDAYFYRDSPVAVVGNDNYAATEALMLLDYTDDVRILTNGSSFEAGEELKERVDDAGIPVITDDLDRLTGEEVLEAVVTKAGDEIPVDGLFVALGTAGGTDLAEMLGVPVDGDDIVTDPDQSTPVDRVYAYTEIRRLTGVLELPDSVRDAACALFDSAQEESLLRGR